MIFSNDNNINNNTLLTFLSNYIRPNSQQIETLLCFKFTKFTENKRMHLLFLRKVQKQMSRTIYLSV